MSWDNNPPAVSVHRFVDSVSLALLRTISTVYMEPDDARALAASIAAAADSIDAEPFARSAFGSATFPAVAQAGGTPRLERSPDGRRAVPGAEEADSFVGFPQAFVVTMETGAVFLVYVRGEDSRHGKGLALSAVAAVTPAQVWDSAAFPVDTSAPVPFGVHVLAAPARADLAAALAAVRGPQ